MLDKGGDLGMQIPIPISSLPKAHFILCYVKNEKVSEKLIDISGMLSVICGIYYHPREHDPSPVALLFP